MSLQTTRAAVAGGLGLLVGLLGVPAAGADVADRRAPRVEMVDLTPTLSARSIAARMINDRGVVVIEAVRDDSSGDSFVLRWKRGTLTELDGLGGGSSSATSINARGQIAGASQTDDGRHAVVWQPDGTLVDLDPDGVVSWADSIDRRGTVLGHISDPTSVATRTVLWRDGVATEIVPGALSTFSGADLNDRGVALVNVRDGATGLTHPVLWDDGTLTHLPAVDTTRGGAEGEHLNNKGQVVGSERTGQGEVPEIRDALVWDGADVVRLSAGGLFAVQPTDINDRGVVVGHYGECGQCPRFAFVARDGVLTSLPALGGEGLPSRALAINQRGDIVGESWTADSQVHATLWVDDEPIDLGSFGGPSVALDINRRGQIVGWSQDERQFVQHAVLWTVRR